MPAGILTLMIAQVVISAVIALAPFYTFDKYIGDRTLRAVLKIVVAALLVLGIVVGRQWMGVS